MTRRAPLEEAEIAAMQLSRVLAGAMPDGWLFGLFLFSAGENGFMTWASNCERRSVIKGLREWLATHPEDRTEDQT